jgi:hypothetical protein
MRAMRRGASSSIVVSGIERIAKLTKSMMSSSRWCPLPWMRGETARAFDTI